MKTCALLLASAAAFVAQIDAHSICYDPAHVSTVTVDTINNDLQVIKNNGFTHIRTYYTAFGTTDLGTLAIAAGLNVSLGVAFDNDDPTASADDITAAIACAGNYTASADSVGVVQIFVGNENLASATSVPSEQVSYIEKLQAALPNVPIGTVQRNTEMLDSTRISAVSGMSDLFTTCDVVGVNIHPVFTADTAAADAITLVSDQWTELQGSDTESNFPGLASKLAITETGWPSDGTADGNTGTVAGAKTFFDDYKTWSAANLADDRSFYFQMFDQPYRTDGVFEPYFGIIDKNGDLKFTAYSSASASYSAGTV